MMAMHNPPFHIVFHGGNMETLDYEVELGRRAAFDLYHHDSTLYCAHGLTASDGFCYRGCEPGFFEPDEPVEDIRLAFEQGEQGLTGSASS